MIGEVIRAEPPRLLIHSWGEAFGEPSEVTYELEERDGQTLLVLPTAGSPRCSTSLAAGMPISAFSWTC